MYVGDVQDSINGKANHFFREALQRHPDTEFFVFGGDLTERPTEQRWEETYRGLDSIGQQYPVITVTGNHEYLKYIIRKLERRFSLVFSYYLDSMVGENQVYTLKYNDMQIFCLDSNREFFYLWTQKKWLEEQLKKSNARWKIVVLHHPLYSIKGSMNNLFQRTMFNPLVEEYGVDLVLQGHEHAYARMTAHGENGEAKHLFIQSVTAHPKTTTLSSTSGSTSSEQVAVTISKSVYMATTLTMNAYDATTNDLYDAVDIIKDKTGKSRLEDRGKEIPEALIFHSNGGKKEEASRSESMNTNSGKVSNKYKMKKGFMTFEMS